MILHPGNGEHRRMIEFGVIEPVEQMDSPRTRGAETAAELARVFGVSAGNERGGFFVADVNETYRVPRLAQSLHHAIDAVAGDPEDHIHTPIVNRFDENVGRSFGHRVLDQRSNDEFLMRISSTRPRIWRGSCSAIRRR